MAGLIGLTAADIDIQDALGAARWEYDDKWIPHPVVRLTTTLPIAVNRPEGRTVVRARWGFDVGGGRPIGNARDDRLTESPMWKAMLGKSHCLFATTGIYEQVKSPKKQSYWFRRRDGKLIVMPGLVGERGVKGEKRLCAAIVTTAPNDLFKSFHDRQVCSLAPKEADAWMEGGEPSKMSKLLHSPGNEEWEAVRVDDRIFKHGRIETEDLIPMGEPVRWTGAPPKRASRQQSL
ncbi:MAG TPA: SOS response-associated peptidase family protein [Candidatus Thermoplasmatota archaeon]